MSEYLSSNNKKITAPQFFDMKHSGHKISMLTAYDYTMASIVDAGGVDSILVGDSASNVMEGNATTLPITIDEMICYAKSVALAAKHALVLCDMPFGSYQIGKEDALRNAVKIMKLTGVDALKLEGGVEIADTIRAMVNMGIPVCGHLGLTPQSVHKFGGYGLRAKNEAEAEKLLSDAKALDAAGCFAIVLEKVPAVLAEKVTASVSCATIGIGAGVGTDGQVLVSADMLGLNKGFRPKFLRQYVDGFDVLTKAVAQYVSDVESCDFPSKGESY